MYGNIIKDNFRDKFLSGEINREDYDEENVCKFLSLLKIRTSKKIDNTKELTEEEENIFNIF